MKAVYCDVHGTLIGGPVPLQELVQPLHDTRLPIIYVSGSVGSA